jgi:hypothetical protein
MPEVHCTATRLGGGAASPEVSGSVDGHDLEFNITQSLKK